MINQLSTTNHSRDIVGLKYIYPVLSRRAGGLSIGINFNTNNACNWRCVYCQVPNLVRGCAPAIDFQLLEEELRFFIKQVVCGDFFAQFNITKTDRTIKDIAISGNGEPTSSKDFDKAVQLIGRIAKEYGVLPASDFVLISNGSLMHQRHVQNGLQILNDYQGQVWFKLDCATEQARRKINNSHQSNKNLLTHLKLSSHLCETRLQTCVFDFLSATEMVSEKIAYLTLLNKIKQSTIKIQKVMLYTLARPSLQKEAGKLKKQDLKVIKQFAERIEALGYQVTLS